MKLKTKDIIFIIIVLGGLVMFVIQKFSHKDVPDEGDMPLANITIQEATVLAEIANTDETRYVGLGDRESMDSNHGMFFIHETPDRYSYSMRGMRFDLDFIFVRENKVVDIAKNVAFEYRGRIQGAVEYDRVLEVNADWVRANDIKIRDVVIIEE